MWTAGARTTLLIDLWPFSILSVHSSFTFVSAAIFILKPFNDPYSMFGIILRNSRVRSAVSVCEIYRWSKISERFHRTTGLMFACSDVCRHTREETPINRNASGAMRMTTRLLIYLLDFFLTFSVLCNVPSVIGFG